MTYGVLTANARKFNVESNSCHHAIQAITDIRYLNLTGGTCSADPVVAGSTVTLTYSSAPTSVVWTVATQTASVYDGGMVAIAIAGTVVVLFALGFFGGQQ